MQSSFVVWYPTGKFALLIVEITSDKLDDFPEKYQAFKEQAGPEAEFRILPMGVKKWSKQIDEIQWVAASSLLPDAEPEVSDLLGSMLQISGFRQLLEGTPELQADPAGTLVTPPPA